MLMLKSFLKQKLIFNYFRTKEDIVLNPKNFLGRKSLWEYIHTDAYLILKKEKNNNKKKSLNNTPQLLNLICSLNFSRGKNYFHNFIEADFKNDVFLNNL